MVRNLIDKIVARLTRRKRWEKDMKEWAVDAACFVSECKRQQILPEPKQINAEAILERFRGIAGGHKYYK